MDFFRFKITKLIAVFSAALLMFSAVQVSAERPEEPPLTDEMIETLLVKYHITPESQFYDRTRNALLNVKKKRDMLVIRRERKAGDGKSRIVKHLRGKEGIPLPGPMDLRLPFEVTKESLEEGVKEYTKFLGELGEKALEIPELPSCDKSNTTKERLVPKGMKVPQANTIVFDMIFLPKGKEPLSAKEYFGQRVVTGGYTNESQNGPSYIALSLGAKCLPYRIRATNEFVFKHEGEAALKNYDKNPHGKGKLHKALKGRTNDFF